MGLLKNDPDCARAYPKLLAALMLERQPEPDVNSDTLLRTEARQRPEFTRRRVAPRAFVREMRSHDTND
jgi:hypothetical protein